MLPVENPVNPLLATHYEWLEPQAAEVVVVEERAKSLLTRNDSPDVPFRWSVNPYRGCRHACAYCYARRTHEYLDLGAGSDFETRIVAKINAPELLAQELRRPSWNREQIAFSGVTDCYQPSEAKYRLTRQCLELCLERANPVGIVTKAPLVVRDTDVLLELHRRSDARVLFSITFADDEVARKLEPHAPLPTQRFEAMRRLHAAGLPVGLMLAPVIPGLNDRDIPRLLQRAAACGASLAAYTPIRLPGNVREVFLTRLKRVWPLGAKRVEARVRELRDGELNDPRFGFRMQGRGPYWESVQRLFELAAQRAALDAGQSWRQPPPDPRGPRQLPLFPDADGAAAVALGEAGPATPRCG